jgi:anti-sigma factor RsiW
MSECDEQLLGAYHDGELNPTDRARVEQHLAQCPTCSAELARLRQASQLLREYPFQDITPDELTQLHQAIDESNEDQFVWRIGGTLGLIAASILVVGFAWLRSLPTATPIGQQQTQLASHPAPVWERVAVTLRPDPFSHSEDEVQMAEADYMVETLGQQRMER